MNLFDFGKPIEPMKFEEKAPDLDFQYIESDQINDIVLKIDKNKFPQSSIFHGNSGLNNIDFIKSIILHIIRNLYKDGNSENIFLNKSHPDIMILDKNPILIDDVRLIHEFLKTKPSVMDHKIIGINNIENMNISSYNAMLKILEEPRESVYFFITSNNINNIIHTIKSRCAIINIINNESTKHSCKYGDKCIVRDVSKYFNYCNMNDINLVYDNIIKSFDIGYINFDVKQIPNNVIMYCIDNYLNSLWSNLNDDMKMRISYVIRDCKQNFIQNALYNTNIDLILNDLIAKVKNL
jgi:hypothetical protein